MCLVGITHETEMMIHNYGVFVSREAELVTSKEYSILFLSGEAKLSVYLFQSNTGKVIHAVTIYKSYGTNQVEYFLSYQGGINYIKGNTFWNTNNPGIIDIRFFEDIAECSINGNIDKIILSKVESISDGSISDKHTYENETDVCSCLYNWNKGVFELKYMIGKTEYFEGVIINTNKHMYVFRARENERIYVCAWRYKCCNRGIAYSPNYMLYSDISNSGNAQFMINMDNRQSGEDMDYDEKYFKTGICISHNNTYYCPVYSCTHNKIALTGFGGTLYYISPGKPMN